MTEPLYEHRAADWLFEMAANYLRRRGWGQDPADPALWQPGNRSIGAALDAQFLQDGLRPWFARYDADTFSRLDADG